MMGSNGRTAFAAALALWMSGCSEDSSAGEGGSGGSPGTFAGLCTLAFSPEGATGFVRLVSEAELRAGGRIESFDRAIEISGGVSCAVWRNAVFAASFESPTITRYDAVDGVLVEGETVSFFNFGLSSLSSLSEQIQVFSDTKAYFVDPVLSQIIVWNPTTMETVEAIPLTGFDAPDGVAVSTIRSARIGDRLVLWASYVNSQEVQVSRGVFGFVDPVTDEIVTDSTDACGGFISASVTTSNGDAYFGMSGAVAVAHALELRDSFPPCAVRVRAGASEIDPSFVADLDSLTGVGPTAGPFAGFGTQGLLLAYDEIEVPLDPLLSPLEHSQLRNWRVYETELGTSGPATLVQELPADSGIGGTLTFDGRGFLTRFTSDFSGTNLFDLSRRPIEIAFTVDGALQSLARLGE